MRRIEDEQTLQQALAAEQAILFFHCAWGYSWFLLPAVEKWEREWVRSGTGPKVALYSAVDDGKNPTYPATLLVWLKSQSLDGVATAGNGEMLWLQRGRVVDKLLGRGPRGVTPAELTRRTVELWGFD